MSKRSAESIAVAAEPETVRVTAPVNGALSFGAMQPGQTYSVSPHEAERLVRCKGFTINTEAKE